MRYSLMCLVLHVHQCISFPPLSTLSYKEIEKEIQNEVSSMASAVKEEHLIGIAAQAKYDCQKMQHKLEKEQQRVEHERQRADQFLERAIHEKNDKETLQQVHIRLSPRALVDSIQETYELEYYELMESYQRKLVQLRKEQTDLSASITNVKNELRNPNLTGRKKTAKESQLVRLESRLREIPQEIEEYEKKLPPKISQVDTRGTRIARRKHMWQWIMMNKVKESWDVKNIWLYIKKWYTAKDEPFKQQYSLEQYTTNICESIAAIYEASNDAAQVLERIPLEEGYEFKMLPIYRKENLDEAFTILVNAIGISYLFHDVTDTGVTTVPLLPGAITQKKSVF